MIIPAIVVVGYNRPISLKRLLTSIADAEIDYYEVPLVISLDFSESTPTLLRIAEEFDWKHGDKIIQVHEPNLGLRQHILSCGDLSERYGAVIILEDDLIVSKGFYNYASEALNYYKDEEWCSGVALYSHRWNEFAGLPFEPDRDWKSDIFLAQYGVTWGQAWTWDQWRCFKEWYATNSGELPYRNDLLPQIVTNWGNNSWGKYFYHYIVTQNKYYVVPFDSMSSNYSDIGIHRNQTTATYQVPLSNKIRNFMFSDNDNSVIYDSFFERKNLTIEYPEKIDSDKVVIDLYGLKDIGANRYIVTPKTLKYNIVKSYGLILRPHEMNIIHNISGDDIHLYDTEQNTPYNKFNIDASGRRLSYYFRETTLKNFVLYSIYQCKKYIINLIKQYLINCH